MTARALSLACVLAACGRLHFGELAIDGAADTATDAHHSMGVLQPHLDFATGPGPYAIAIGDIDGDGKPDLVSSNFGGGSISILRNTTAAGVLSFAPNVDVITGAQGDGVALADVNGDGRLDVAACNEFDKTVSILLNTTPFASSAISFAAPLVIAESDPRSVAFADINGDGKPDLVVVEFGANAVSVALDTTAAGAMTASFAAKVDFPVGSQPIFVATGDFNGDGRPDVAVANNAASTVSVLLNTTPGGAMVAALSAATDLPSGKAPLSVTAADVDGDGKLDLATADLDDNTISIYVNTTALFATPPSFAARASFPTNTQGPQGVAFADLDQDGRPDLVLSYQRLGEMSALHSTTPSGGPPRFAAHVDYGVAMGQAVAIAVGDLDGDGAPDVVVANSSASSLSVLLDR